MNEFIILLWKLCGATVIVGLGLFLLNGPESALGLQFLKLAMLGLFGIAALQLGGIASDMWQNIAPDLKRFFIKNKKAHGTIPAPEIHDEIYQAPVRQKRPKHRSNDDLIP